MEWIDSLAEIDLVSTDVVVTPFFLDCLEEEEARVWVRQLVERLRPGGIWLNSEFCVPAHGWRRWRAQGWIAVMYAFFRVTTGLKVRSVPDYSAMMRALGLILEREHLSQSGLVTAELWRKPASGN
jgi:hypothetical protein